MFGSLLGNKKKKYFTCRVSMDRPVLDAMLLDGINASEWMVITFFKSTAERLSSQINNDSLKELIIPADKISSGMLMQKIKSFISQPGKMIVMAERYPLSSYEIHVSEKLSENGIPLPVIAFASLDDALLQYFGGEKVKSMMQRMGIKENELMEHSMIEKSIENAQEKLAKKVTLESKANSAEEWFRMNFPNVN